jgi:hypothetical protein
MEFLERPVSMKSVVDAWAISAIGRVRSIRAPLAQTTGGASAITMGWSVAEGSILLVGCVGGAGVTSR